MRQTKKDRVLALIRAEPGLTDRQIRERTGIESNQHVNNICHEFAREGVIERERGPEGFIVNNPALWPITMQDASDMWAAITAVNNLTHSLAATQSAPPEVQARTVVLDSHVRRGKDAGLTVVSPKPKGFDALVEFYTFRFATVWLATERKGFYP